MLRTKSGLPKHCSWNTDRHGKRRVRFRKAGFTTYLTGTPWSEDFMRQYAGALDGVKKKNENVGAELRTKPGSLNELCVAYYRSPGFLDLKDSTKDGRRGIIESFRKLHGDKPVAKLQRQHVEQIIAEKHETPNAANNLLKVLKLLLNHAVSIDMIATTRLSASSASRFAATATLHGARTKSRSSSRGIRSAPRRGWPSPFSSTRRSECPT